MNNQVTHSNFGLLIAYALPGYLVVWALGGVFPAVFSCFGEECSTIPSLVGFLNSTVAAIAFGMTVSALRFFLIDSIHEHTGLKRPVWNGVALQKNLEAVNTVVLEHYRYYQFHANMIIAGVIAYGAYLYNVRLFTGFPEMVIVVLVIVFWVTARDNLRKYYQNLDAIFSIQKERMDNMSNGMHPKQQEEESGKKNTDKTGSKTEDKSEKKNTGAKSKTSGTR